MVVLVFVEWLLCMSVLSVFISCCSSWCIVVVEKLFSIVSVGLLKLCMLLWLNNCVGSILIRISLVIMLRINCVL